MKKANVLPAPSVDRPATSKSKWAREQRAFFRLRSALLRTQRDRYVAIHEGKAVDSGEDEIALGLRVYAKFGYVPIYVGRVSEKPDPAARIPSPRLKRTDS
jgi:hypothetical protein